MVRSRLWIALGLAAAIVVPGTSVAAQEMSPAPGSDLSVPLRREPPAIWSDILNARDEIYFYTDEEELDKVREVAADLNQLKREFQLSIMDHMSLKAPRKPGDKEKSE